MSMISDLKLIDYRSYEESVFEFGKNVNIIVGPNASGKTNLLEAILVVCSGKSYRVKDADLVSFEKPWTRLEATADSIPRRVSIDYSTGTSKKKFTINNEVFSRLSLQKKIPVVVFEPDHLRMLTGGPERRREYLDTLLEQTVSGYGKILRDYKRALSQRNSLLKQSSGYPNSENFFVWDVRLSELGGIIVKARTKIVGRLNRNIEALYGELAQSSQRVLPTIDKVDPGVSDAVVEQSVFIDYKSDCDINDYSNSVLGLYSSNLDKDLQRGFTGNGPHRHDFTINLKGYDASLTASRGESRTLLLAMKLLEMSIIEEISNKKPILLLDDVFSELDGARRKALTGYLKDHQTFITTTDADIVIQHFTESCTIIPLG